MSTREEVREFLTSRRAHVTPEQAGLPDFGGERRVPGLRREEVAMLAGVSLAHGQEPADSAPPGTEDH